MTRANDTAVIAVFADRAKAERAYDELKSAGFRDEQIGYAARNGTEGLHESDVLTHAVEGVAAGAVGGGALGAACGLAVATGLLPGVGPIVAAGALIAILLGAGAGVAAGGLAGLLIGLGVPEEHAGFYEQQLLEGRTLITVQAGERNGEALVILRQHALPTETTAKREALTGTPA
jgi:hypothetical protein